MKELWPLEENKYIFLFYGENLNEEHTLPVRLALISMTGRAKIFSSKVAVLAQLQGVYTICFHAKTGKPGDEDMPAWRVRLTLGVPSFSQATPSDQ